VGAYYGEFVQLERPKKNSQFGVNRTVVFGDAERVVQRSRVEAMSMIDVKRVG
jgi:hypothetical protein